MFGFFFFMTVTQWVKWDQLKLQQMHQASARFPHIIRNCFVDFDWGLEGDDVVALRDEDGDIERFNSYSPFDESQEYHNSIG